MLASIYTIQSKAPFLACRGTSESPQRILYGNVKHSTTHSYKATGEVRKAYHEIFQRDDYKGAPI